MTPHHYVRGDTSWSESQAGQPQSQYSDQAFIDSGQLSRYFDPNSYSAIQHLWWINSVDGYDSREWSTSFACQPGFLPSHQELPSAVHRYPSTYQELRSSDDRPPPYPQNLATPPLDMIDTCQCTIHCIPRRKRTKCKIEGCEMTFGRPVEMRRHVESFHVEPPIICDACTKHFKRIDILKRHRQIACRVIHAEGRNDAGNKKRGKRKPKAK